jgi:pSer/pThr/pTyr-binding forkhead associated (FHA) protein
MAGEQLRVTEGKARGARLSVDIDLLIGRLAPDDEGRLGDDPVISRRHARVSRGVDGQLTIEDLGSANGTYVNDERLDTPRMLDPGDVIRVGRTLLEVIDPSGVVSDASRQPAGSEPAQAPDPPADAGRELVVTGGGGPGPPRTPTHGRHPPGPRVCGGGCLGAPRPN